MKYLLTILSALILLSSCIKDSYYERKYTIVASFQSPMTKFNSDSLSFTTNKMGGFAWEDLAFFHRLNTNDTKLEGGFAMTNMVGRLETTDKLPANPYRVYTKGSKSEANIYTVFKINEDPSLMPKKDITFLNSNYGTCSLIGCYIANSEKVVEQVKAKFEDGDSLTVIAKGYLKDKLTGELKRNLVKYSAAKDSIVSKWTAFELDKLGNVDRIDFEMISTKPGIDRIFCMDNMVASIFIKY